jgi:hypothetical protein
MAWMPSWEFPAMRMIASETLEIFGAPLAVGVNVDSLMQKKCFVNGSFRPKKT